MKWVKARERLPEIDNKNPQHFTLRNNVVHHAINIWTEFIERFPPIITNRLQDWEWLDESPIKEDGGDELTFGEYMKLIGANWDNAPAKTIWNCLMQNGFHITKKSNTND